MPDDISALLLELRRLRVEQSRIAERMGRLEKQLRIAVPKNMGPA
jgi:hypothetical protein